MPASRTSTCPTCNTAVDDGDRFCKTCGTEVSGISASPVSGQGAAWATGAAPAVAPGSPWDGVLARLREVTMGEFDVGRELGRGGMAAVFLAHDLTLGRKVAIKVMAPGLMMGEGMVARFRQEAITIANLQHANIVTVHAVRQLADLHFFVMQFVEGQSLEGVLRDHGALPLPVVKAIMHQVGSALAYAHRRGVIHRDVKPGNILLSGDGDALVTDFGIAKVAEGPTQTQTGMVVGTPTYMSPEQCYAAELDGASDQYSLGIVAYQMLAGHAPFSGPAFSIMKGHTTEPVPSLREFAPDVPDHVEAAILRMLAKKPADRFATFADALAAMGAEPLGEHSPVRAEMIRFAAVQEIREALGDLLRTPSSPVPGSRSGARAGASGGLTPRTPSPSAVAPPSIAVAVAPPPEAVEVGDRITLRATVRGASEQSPLVWHTESPDLVQVDSATGLLTAIAEGDAVVVAQSGNVTDRLVLRVIAPRAAVVQLRPIDTDVHVGDVVRLTATVADKRGAALEREVEWSAVGASLRLDADGTAHALSVGRTAITVACDEHYDTLVLHVLPARVAELEILAPSEPLEVGHAVTLGVIARDAHGTRLTDRGVQWSVDRPERARVDAAGVFTALAAGAVRVHARCEERDAALELVVPPARAASVTITNMPDLVRDGDRFTLLADARDMRRAPVTSSVAWRSSTPAVATIDAQGAVHARTAGTTDISVTVDGVTASSRLVVHATPAAFAAAVPVAGGAPAASATAILSAINPTGDASNDAQRVAAETAASHVRSDATNNATRVATGTPTSGASASAAHDATQPAGAPPAHVNRKRPAWLIGAAVVPVVLIAWLVTRGGDESATSSSVPPNDPAGAGAEAVAGAAPATSAPGTGTPGANAANANQPGANAPGMDAAATSDGSAANPSVAPAADARLELRLVPPTTPALRVSETLRLSANIVDARSGQRATGAAVTFTSSDRAIATVDRRTGEVRAIKPGRVTITADAGDVGRETVRLTIEAATTASAQPTRNQAAESSGAQTVTPPAVTPTAPATPPSTVTTPPPTETAVVSQAQLAREARTLIDTYARAFASKDIGRLRAINPSMPADEQSFYTDLFRNSETVTVTVKSVNPTGSRREYDPTVGANTSVAATFDFVFVSKNRSVGRQESEGSWQVTLQRESAGWKLVRLVTG